MNQLPSIHEPPSQNDNAVDLWVSKHAAEITVKTLLNTVDPRPDILKELLHRVRWTNSRARPFSKSQFNEERVRAEVYDLSDQFCFYIGELRQYHPYHISEIILLLLKLLKDEGVDATR